MTKLKPIKAFICVNVECTDVLANVVEYKAGDTCIACEHPVKLRDCFVSLMHQETYEFLLKELGK